MAQEGGCMCGNIRYSLEGEPVGTALCHCRDCRKISGSTYSSNAIYPGDGFKLIQGTPKKHTKTADGGTEIISYFCGDCGSTMWRDSASFGTNKIIKVGTLDADDALDKHKPKAELFVPTRVAWVPEISGAEQKQTMA